MKHCVTRKQQKGFCYALALLVVLLFAFLFTGCALLDKLGGSDTDDGTVAVTSVTLNKTSITMGVGDRATVTATVMPTIAKFRIVNKNMHARISLFIFFVKQINRPIRINVNTNKLVFSH